MEPAESVIIRDRFFGELGYFVIDTAFRGNSVGGVRILPDVSMREISHMARTQTRKYLFTGLPLGGAKAGLVLGRKAMLHRQDALKAFGKAISGHIFSGFWPGCDIGSSPEDIKTILRGAGVPSLSTPPETGRYTAISIISSIDAALEMNGFDWSGCRIAVEGFGKVGSAVAELAAAEGARIVSVSNTRGSIHLERGLDLELIGKLRKDYGNAFVERYPHIRPSPKERIFSVDCDVFIPCARCWSINGSNANRLKAKIIACGANVPMTPDTERSLFEKRKAIIPDVVANCGGVLGGNLVRFLDEGEIKNVFDERFRRRAVQVLECGRPPSEYLEAFCSRRMEEIKADLLPFEKSKADFLADSFAYHITDRIFGKGRLLRGLFPE
jgi:glutamate dehydrogenase/leucine dehydrogenase